VCHELLSWNWRYDYVVNSIPSLLEFIVHYSDAINVNALDGYVMNKTQMQQNDYPMEGDDDTTDWFVAGSATSTSHPVLGLDCEMVQQYF
jgi:hypothetical protein